MPNMAERELCSAELYSLGLVPSLSKLLQDEYRPTEIRYCLRASPHLLSMLQMPQETELKQTFIQVSYFVRMNVNKAW